MQRASSIGGTTSPGGQPSTPPFGSSGPGGSLTQGNSRDNDPTQPQGSKPSIDLSALSTSTSSGPALLPNVRITADVANNALLIYANRDQYKIVERAIFELDRAPMQVAVDVTVAEVTLKGDLQYGVQFYLKSIQDGKQQGSIGLSASGVASGVLSRLLPGANLVLGSDTDPRVVLSALNSITDVKVISSPALVVLDNQQATLQVGDEVAVATRTETSVITPGAPVLASVERRSTGVILRVTPRVNANGVVNLDVIQEVSAPQPSPADPLNPTISQRKVQSSIAVASGQTVLLGGLISTRNERSKQGLPALMDLKGIGDLFASNTKRDDRTELIMFIRPQIIRNGIDAQLVAEELRSKLSVIGRSAPVPTGPPALNPRRR
jgi:general secretion pathway protein D